MNKIANAYLIRCITNLHAGKGDTTYGVIDNEVQRDPIDDYPVIHSSTLKGALREHFDACKPHANNNEYHETVNKIFGYATKSGVANKDDASPGSFHFHEARMLAIPVRCDITPYVMVTSPGILNDFVELLELYDVKNRDKIKIALNGMPGFTDEHLKEDAAFYGPEPLDGGILEDFEYKTTHAGTMPKVLIPLFGNAIALVSTKKLKHYSKRLPVIARNKLHNGESENLFYEEIVPRETRFYTLILNDQGLMPSFEDILGKKKLLQIGANATIGYGKTHFSKIIIN